MTTLFLIVARSGSKRLPWKNMRTINGISLIGYKALAAGQAQHCDALMMSTDNPLLAEEARHYGVTVPFLRPDTLATDTATSEDVVRHAMTWMEQNDKAYDAIMLLEPSSPFVSPDDYDRAIELMIEKEAQFVCGSVLYLFRWEYLKTRADLYDNPQDRVEFELEPEHAVDIDTIRDLHYAEFLVEKEYVDLSWAQE